MPDPRIQSRNIYHDHDDIKIVENVKNDRIPETVEEVKKEIRNKYPLVNPDEDEVIDPTDPSFEEADQLHKKRVEDLENGTGKKIESYWGGSRYRKKRKTRTKKQRKNKSKRRNKAKSV